jgi:hypothetical protein
MSIASCEALRMKNSKRSPVVLEPGLEEEALLMTPAQRRAAARKFRRWARQLEVSANILDKLNAPKPSPSLKVVPLRVLTSN